MEAYIPFLYFFAIAVIFSVGGLVGWAAKDSASKDEKIARLEAEIDRLHKLPPNGRIAASHNEELENASAALSKIIERLIDAAEYAETGKTWLGKARGSRPEYRDADAKE